MARRGAEPVSRKVSFLFLISGAGEVAGGRVGEKEQVLPTRCGHLGAIEQAMWSTLPTRFQHFRQHQRWKVAGSFIQFGFLKEQTHKERVSKKNVAAG